jgi:hemerythrin
MLDKLKIQKKFSILETTGLPLIDLDHNRLIILLKYIVESLKKGKRLSKIQELAKYLEDGLKMHFLHEEEVMKTIQYPNIRQHSIEHLEMLDHYRNYTNTINSKSCRQNLLENFINIYEKLKFHILNDDLKFKPFVTKNTIVERVSRNFYTKLQKRNEMKDLERICKAICKKK